MDAPHSTLAGEDADPPSYGKAELQRALVSERAAEATLERRVGEGEIEAKLADRPAPGAIHPALEDPLRVATADLAVRRRSSPRWRSARPPAMVPAPARRSAVGV